MRQADCLPEAADPITSLGYSCYDFLIANDILGANFLLRDLTQAVALKTWQSQRRGCLWCQLFFLQRPHRFPTAGHSWLLIS